MKNDELVCPICGEPTSVYMGNARKDRLCRKHALMAKAGQIVLCPDCGKWHEVGKLCDCKKETHYNSWTHSETVTPTNDELTCIICGKPSNGKHFCTSCYYKFKDKTLYIQVKKCKEFTKLEAEYESELTCEDGHMVKSPYEKIIDNWLYQAGIQHAYEKAIDIDETHDIHPDFYIPEFNSTKGNIKDIYIEFWGYGEENIKYTETKKYKEALYPKLCKERNITVLYLTKSDCDKTSTEFIKKLKYLMPSSVNE